MRGKLGRLYIGNAGATTLTDVGIVRFNESVTEEAVTTEADTFGRRIPLAFDVTVTVTFMQTGDADVFEILKDPTQPYRLFISPSPGAYGSTVTWSDALSDPDGYTLDNVYYSLESTLDLGGSESSIVIRFRKRRRRTFISDGIESSSLFFVDFTHLASDPDRQKNVLFPYVGTPGSFSRPTTRPYFDENGNYKTAATNELIWSRSPSGLLLPVVWPAVTNQVVNNTSDGPTDGYQFVKLTGNVLWNGFNLGRYAANTVNDQHRLNLITMTSVATGDVLCASCIYKPKLFFDYAKMMWEFYDGTLFTTIKATINLNDGSTILDAENTRWKALKAGRIALPNGYYYIFFSVYLKDATNVVNTKPFVFLYDSTGQDSFVGDGTTELAEIGAHCVFKNTIYPPAPIPTSGSTVTVSQDVLSFPFVAPFPNEGLTAHIEIDVPIDNSSIINTMSPNYIAVGIPSTAAGGSYSPLGVVLGYNRIYIALDNIINAAVTNNWSGYIKESLQLTSTDEKYFTDGVLKSSEADGRTTTDAAFPIDFKVNSYAPIWIRRYALVRGIVDPKVLLS